MRAKLLFFIVGCLIVFCSSNCTSKNEFIDIEKPENLLSEEKFTQVLSDIVLLESVAINNSPARETAHKQVLKSCGPIFKKHHVSKKNYEESFTYYAHDKEKMEEIYAEILENYNVELSKIK
jgi:hypothetical protein